MQSEQLLDLGTQPGIPAAVIVQEPGASGALRKGQGLFEQRGDPCESISF